MSKLSRREWRRILFLCRNSHSQWFSNIVWIAVFVASTTSCTRWADLRADQYRASEEKFLDVERANYKNLNARPQYCLALSGGGIRAAAYGIGVLKGLHESGKLSDYEIISAVSGGSYAATWLYAQQDVSGASGLEKVLSSESIHRVAERVRFVENKSRWAEAVGQSIPGVSVTAFRKMIRGGGLVSGWFIYAGQLICSWLNCPPSHEGHRTSTGAEYETILGRSFHYIPHREERLILPVQTVRAKELPYLIVNATVQRLEGDSRLANKVFEFTPLGIGSPSVSYHIWTELSPFKNQENQDIHRGEQYTLSRIASISGAVVDSQATRFMPFFWNDFGLCYEMLAPTHTEGETKQFILLTDGGHSENLGVYSLIRRNCREILVVDAEYDGKIDWVDRLLYGSGIGNYQFEAYRLLNNNLLKEGKILKIDRLHQATCHMDSKWCPEDMSDKVVTTKQWNCWNKEEAGSRALFDCSEPISVGFVHRCLNKDKDCKDTERVDIGVTYMKLSADRRLLDDLSPAGRAKATEVFGPRILKYYDRSDTKFPHYPTFQFNWDKEQFLVIAELGCRAVMQHYAPQVLSQNRGECIDRI